jgi:phosphoglycolate phosphatase-like HAD superfamily hydrolase
MEAVYFDLDGTLTDPKIGITRSIQYALDKLNHHAIPTADELTWCGDQQAQRLRGAHYRPFRPAQSFRTIFPEPDSPRIIAEIRAGVGKLPKRGWFPKPGTNQSAVNLS